MCSRRPAQGLALVAVLWIVAALSILATSMSYAVRDEIRQAARARHAGEAAALGDAAIQLVLQEMVGSAAARPTRLVRVERSFLGQSVDVEVMPLSGLIDINSAGEALLLRLFVVAGQLNAGAAAALAQTILDVRSQLPRSGARTRAFEAPEDLLRVPGMEYPLYARIAGLVTVDGQSDGRVNALAAPADVLLVLADGNAANAGRVAAARDAAREGVDTTTTLNGNYLGSGRTSRFRLVARVGLPDGRKALVSRTVDLEDGARDGLPWRTLQMQRSIEAG